jgi:putative redox protein
LTATLGPRDDTLVTKTGKKRKIMAQKKATIRQVNGITLAGKTDSNHWVMMDGPETFGGSNAAIRPKELILLALGGCTSSDVISILNKKRSPIDSFEMHISANAADEHPQVYTDIHLEYVFYGDGIKPDDIERAIELSSTKYCSVSAMLQASVKIAHSYRIEAPKNTPVLA